MQKIQLRDLCGARAGDKGDISNIALFAYSEPAYEAIREAVTAELVKEHFGAFVKGPVERYEVPNVWALNFVLHEALGGGGSDTLRSDSLGKTFGGSLLRLVVSVPDDVAGSAPRNRPVVIDEIPPPLEASAILEGAPR